MKCRYYPTAPICFSRECVLIFRALSENVYAIDEKADWCIINKSDLVKKIDEEHGLAKVDLLDSQKNGFLVEINNPGDHMLSRFYVPRNEVVFLAK